jgi:cytochrome c-type biogenesis protein CcmE
MKTRHKRLVFILLGLTGLGVAAGLALSAFQSNLVFFYTPTQVLSGEAPVNKPFRVGGLVEPGSVKKDGFKVIFVVTDTAKSIPVRYEGILPDLFREGQGIVAQGRLGADNQFVAEQVLAKHDENYMPPEVAGALKDANVKP